MLGITSEMNGRSKDAQLVGNVAVSQWPNGTHEF